MTTLSAVRAPLDQLTHAASLSALIVAFPTLHRQGLLAVLQATWPLLTCTLLTDVVAALPLLRQRSFSVIVLDCQLFTDSIAPFLRQLRAIRGAQPVLLLTGPRLPADLRRYLAEAGPTCQWLSRRATAAAAVAACRPYFAVAGPAAPVPVERRRTTASPRPFSRRELDVLRLVIADHCNQEIADSLCLSVRTIESHRRALLQKTGARTLVGLVVQAVREGWVAVA